VRPPLFGIVGWKNSGKTTLISKLIAEFSAKGLNVAAIKHAHHGFDIDHEGRDSFRYRKAGATTVIVSSAVRLAIMKELRQENEPTLPELVSHVGRAGIILVEGFKTEAHPKIEVRRAEAVKKTPLYNVAPSVLAVAADFDVGPSAIPVFRLNDVEAIAAFILSSTKIAA